MLQDSKRNKSVQCRCHDGALVLVAMCFNEVATCCNRLYKIARARGGTEVAKTQAKPLQRKLQRSVGIGSTGDWTYSTGQAWVGEAPSCTRQQAPGTLSLIHI